MPRGLAPAIYRADAFHDAESPTLSYLSVLADVLANAVIENGAKLCHTAPNSSRFLPGIQTHTPSYGLTADVADAYYASRYRKS